MSDNHDILNRYKLILTSAGEGIYGLDSEGRATFANPAAIQMTGWTEEDIIGKPMHEKHHHTHTDGRYYPQHECPIYAALKDGEVHHITDEIFWRKDGTSFPVHYTSTPMIENGVVTGAVVVFQDVTEIKDSERSLKTALFEIQQLKDKLSEENSYLQEEVRLNHQFEDMDNKSQQILYDDREERQALKKKETKKSDHNRVTRDNN